MFQFNRYRVKVHRQNKKQFCWGDLLPGVHTECFASHCTCKQTHSEKCSRSLSLFSSRELTVLVSLSFYSSCVPCGR